MLLRILHISDYFKQICFLIVSHCIITNKFCGQTDTAITQGKRVQSQRKCCFLFWVLRNSNLFDFINLIFLTIHICHPQVAYGFSK